jgi:hypothetical protein
MRITDDVLAVRDRLPHTTRRLALSQGNAVMVLPGVSYCVAVGVIMTSARLP